MPNAEVRDRMEDMTTAEIIAQLPRLTREERAEVQAKLNQLSAGAGTPGDDRQSEAASMPSPRRVITPRLSDPRKASAFRKEVVELADDAQV